MSEVQRIDRPGDGVSVRYLPGNQVALTGPLVAVERKVYALQALDRLVEQPSEFVETGTGRRVTVTVRLRAMPPTPVPLSIWQRPGWIVATILSATALGLVLWLVLATLWPVLLAAAVLAVSGVVVRRRRSVTSVRVVTSVTIKR